VPDETRVGGQRGHRRSDRAAARENPKDEDVKERLEREHTELLEELRALIPGAQVLFGFLLATRFTSPFTDLSTVQRYVYYGTLLTTAVALVLLLAPSAYRLRFREGDKDVMVRKGNREAIAGTGAIALAFTGVLYLITDLVFTTQAAIAVAVPDRPQAVRLRWADSAGAQLRPEGPPRSHHQTGLAVGAGDLAGGRPDGQTPPHFRRRRRPAGSAPGPQHRHGGDRPAAAGPFVSHPVPAGGSTGTGEG
jgi:hypothetical protein